MFSSQKIVTTYASYYRRGSFRQLFVKDETNFLVLSSHRSGSTWVIDVLNNLDRTSAFSEMFLPPAKRVRQNRPFFQLQSQTQTYLDESIRSYPAYHYVPDKKRRLRPFSVFSYLDKLYAQHGSIGFKLMYGQLAAFPEIWPYVMARGISVAHLVRENTLDIIISHEFRKVTRIAHSIAGERESLPPVQIELDPDATIGRMRHLQRNVNWARKLLDLTHVRHIEVKYEELKQNAANFLPLFEFLGRGDKDTVPTSNLVKLVKIDYPDLIRNYAELERRLDDTEFASLLG